MSTYYKYLQMIDNLMEWRNEELATGSRLKASRIDKVIRKTKDRKKKWLGKWWS